MAEYAGRYSKQVFDATIQRLEDYGAYAFLTQLNYVGLIHISQVSQRRLDHPNEVLAIGQKVRVMIVGADARGKLQLSMKAVT